MSFRNSNNQKTALLTGGFHHPNKRNLLIYQLTR